MRLFTFTGETPAEALKKAQNNCGEDALVISTKQLKKKSITSKSLYEVVVAIEDKKEEKQKQEKPRDDVLLNISEAAKQISEIAQVSDTSFSGIKSNAPQNEKQLNNKEYEQIQKELALLTDKMKIIQNMLWEEKSPERNKLIIPPEFSEIYRISKQSGMKDAHLDSIMKLTLEHMPYLMKNNTKTIKRYFQVLLRKMTPIRVEAEIPKGRKKIMMFVGPTGVGKTTTLAKIAARFSFLEYKYKVGIITLDTYRIGAVEQLFQYAKMMKLPIEDVVDMMDFERALYSLSHCDIILVDTVGSSQYDKEKITKISKFLERNENKIDVNLVLSASTKYEDLIDIYNGFSFLDIDTLIVTKFDETKGFGNIFSLVHDIQKPMSYFSVGQEVPDDIMPSASEFLIDCILNGFKKEVK